MLQIKDGTIITLSDSNLVLDNHSIIIEGNIIKDICPTSSVDNSKITKVIDAGNRVVMPGLINCHMHFYSSFARGLNKVNPSENFLEVLQNLWWKLDRELTAEANYYSALVASIEAIQHGTTTIIDHHASPNSITGSLSELAKATTKAGITASLCYEVSDRDGQDKANEGIEENIRFAKEAENREDLHALMGLHASFTLSNETLTHAEKNAQTAGIGFHVHCAEAKADQIDSESKYNLRIVERFNKLGILGPNTILAHGIHLNQKELELIRDTKSNVVINTQSNMNNAVGVSDIFSKIENNIPVAIGTDAMTNNMFEEFRVALWMQKLNSENPSSAFMEITDSLFNQNRILANKFFETKRGEIAKNHSADIAILDYIPHTPLNSETVLGHLVFGVSQAKVRTTIARGKVLMENFEIKHLDQAKITLEATKVAQTVWNKL